MNFTSDNCAGAHPDVMAAITAANEGRLPSYGTDALTEAAQSALRAALDWPEAEIVLMATGTAANALALATLSPPWGRIFCHSDAHIDGSECGAPEMFTSGAKLVLVEGDGGLLDADALEKAVGFWSGEGLNGGQVAAISLANSSEWGRVYTPARMAEIEAIARQHGVALHVDGARFANAVAASGGAAPDLLGGVDVLSLGLTKVGALAAEAVVLRDPALAERAAFLRKRSGHLLSKHRFLAAQVYALLQDGLWLDLAARANAKAGALGQLLSETDGIELVVPVETNQVFAAMPCDLAENLRAQGAEFYDWPAPDHDAAGRVTVRLVCDWATRDDDIATFISAVHAG